MRLFWVSVLLVLGFPFIVSDSVDSFSTCSDFFFKEKPPMIKGILENSVSWNNNRYQPICQRDHNNSYATLYDRENRIPVFSAYKYTGSSPDFETPQRNWTIGQKLENTDKRYYKNQLHLIQSHISPVDEELVCDLTNIVPQYDTFYDGSWSRMEQKVKSIMDSHCRDENDNNKILAYELTGAVPSQNEWLEKEVNIPSHMWTAFCCFNSKNRRWESLAHWAENIDESDDKGKTIGEQSLTNLQDFLKSKYNTEYTLFNGECFDMLNADVSQSQSDVESIVLRYLMSVAARISAGFLTFFGRSA